MQIYLEIAGLAAVDVAAVAILVRVVAAARFRALFWPIVAAAALFWLAFSLYLHTAFWDSYYRYFMTDTQRALAPLAAPFYAVVAAALAWLARRAPIHPVAAFAVLGALESIPEHLLGVLRFGILDIAILREIPVYAIFAFASSSTPPTGRSSSSSRSASTHFVTTCASGVS